MEDKKYMEALNVGYWLYNQDKAAYDELVEKAQGNKSPAYRGYLDGGNMAYGEKLSKDYANELKNKIKNSRKK